MNVTLHNENSQGGTGALPEPPQKQTKIPLVTAQDSIRVTMEVIDRFAKGIAVVVDEDARLLATVTDGDIRRAILAGMNLDRPVNQLQNPGRSKPVTADSHTPESELLALMERYSVRQIPQLGSHCRHVRPHVCNTSKVRVEARPVLGMEGHGEPAEVLVKRVIGVLRGEVS